VRNCAQNSYNSAPGIKYSNYTCSYEKRNKVMRLLLSDFSFFYEKACIHRFYYSTTSGFENKRKHDRAAS